MNRDEYVEHFLLDDPVLQQIEHSIQAHGLPPMSVRPVLGRLLELITRAKGVQHALEIGTYGGYSGVCIARGLANGGRLTTLEMREEHANLARANFHLAHVGDRVDIQVGPALHSLTQLVREGRRFDLIFIDADKPNYPAYLDFALALSREGTVMIADNVFVRDRVWNEADENPSPAALRQFNERLHQDTQLRSAIIPLYDGFSVTVVTRTSASEKSSV